jgi:hypothetical protein
MAFIFLYLLFPLKFFEATADVAFRLQYPDRETNSTNDHAGHSYLESIRDEHDEYSSGGCVCASVRSSAGLSILGRFPNCTEGRSTNRKSFSPEQAAGFQPWISKCSRNREQSPGTFSAGNGCSRTRANPRRIFSSCSCLE